MVLKVGRRGAATSGCRLFEMGIPAPGPRKKLIRIYDLFFCFRRKVRVNDCLDCWKNHGSDAGIDCSDCNRFFVCFFLHCLNIDVRLPVGASAATSWDNNIAFPSLEQCVVSTTSIFYRKSGSVFNYR